MDDDPPAQRFHLATNSNWKEEAHTELINVITPRRPRHFRKVNVISIANYKQEKGQ